MESIRRYVFPIVWMVILAIIALALAKMAFFPAGGASPDDDVAQPGVEFDEYATVGATPADIDSTLDLAATVEADPSTPITAENSGEINKIWVRNGTEVSTGDPILQVREAEDAAPPEEPADDGDEGTSSGDDEPGDATSDEGTDAGAADAAPEPEYRYYTLVAPSDGTIEELDLMEGQNLELGDTAAQLSPDTYAVVADVTPEQQLDMLDGTISAKADLPTTKKPVDCKQPSIEEDDPEEQDQEQVPEVPEGEGYDPALEGEDTGEGSTAQLRCPVPADAKIVPGLTVDVTVDLGSEKDALTVPTTAVTGTFESGTVYQLDEETGEPVEVDVTLGLRGEDVVEVTDGLEEGDEVLEFVPGVDQDEEEMDEGMEW